MFACSLCLLLIIPDDVIRATNQAYHSLYLDIALPFVPLLGIRIDVVELDLNEVDGARVDELFQQVPDPTGLFTLEKITYEFRDETFRVNVSNVFCSTLEEQNASVEFYKLAYGFYEI